jgi:hypothetical protein
MSEEVGRRYLYWLVLCVHSMLGYGQHTKDRSVGTGGAAALWEIVSTVRDAGIAKFRAVLTNNDL